MKHLAVIIERNTQYRILGPIADEALRQGWRVTCWHQQDVNGAKAYQRPTTPQRFRYGAVAIEPYVGLWTNTEADAVIAIRPEREACGLQHVYGQRWVIVQQAAPDEWMLKPSPLNHNRLASVSAWFQDYCIQQGASAQWFADHATPCGWTGWESNRFIDRQSTLRHYLGLSRRPIVVVLPFPQGTGYKSIWPKLHSESSPTLRRIKSAYYGVTHEGPADIDVMRAVRTFCDRENAYMLVKSRRRTPIPRYLKRMADVCLYDDGCFYPPMVVRALNIADLCINYWSLSAMECGSMRVPNLCITYPIEAYCGGPRWNTPFFQSDNPLFNFKSVCRTKTMTEAIRLLETATLDDFIAQRDDIEYYRDTFLGQPYGQTPSQRIMELLCT